MNVDGTNVQLQVAARLRYGAGRHKEREGEMVKVLEIFAWIFAFVAGLSIGLAAILWLQWTLVVVVVLVAAMAAGLWWLERGQRR